MQKSFLSLFFILSTLAGNAQFLMDMVDTTTDMGKGILSIYRQFDHVRFSGYIQSQYQVAEEKGARSFSGGDFSEHTSNRFMLRRGRIRLDYIHFTESNGPSVQFVFQFDGTERGVFIRDFWGRMYENKWKMLGFTAGMFARPFSYELNLSSSDRESPERGRMSQLLMKTERDLGAMVSLEPRIKDHKLKWMKFDVGLFNGQGLASTTDFDSHKDLVTRLYIKTLPLTSRISVSVGLSYLNGGLVQNTIYKYNTEDLDGIKQAVIDSTPANKGRILPRKYYGGDVQLKYAHKAGFTELRAEYMQGTQTAGRMSTETPAFLLTDNEAYYVRKFNGAYFYLLQNIFNAKHQLVIKYDWYDPNTKIQGRIINEAGRFTPADIRYNTWGFGYNYYMNPNLKLLLWYDMVDNESTSLPGFTSDLPDNIFTCRLQFRF